MAYASFEHFELPKEKRQKNGLQMQTLRLGNLSTMAIMPNPPLKPDPAYTVFRSFSPSRFLGSARRLGAGEAG